MYNTLSLNEYAIIIFMIIIIYFGFNFCKSNFLFSYLLLFKKYNKLKKNYFFIFYLCLIKYKNFPKTKTCLNLAINLTTFVLFPDVYSMFLKSQWRTPKTEHNVHSKSTRTYLPAKNTSQFLNTVFLYENNE